MQSDLSIYNIEEKYFRDLYNKLDYDDFTFEFDKNGNQLLLKDILFNYKETIYLSIK